MLQMWYFTHIWFFLCAWAPFISPLMRWRNFFLFLFRNGLFFVVLSTSGLCIKYTDYVFFCIISAPLAARLTNESFLVAQHLIVSCCSTPYFNSEQSESMNSGFHSYRYSMPYWKRIQFCCLTALKAFQVNTLLNIS